MDWTPDRDIAMPDIDRFAELNGLERTEADQALKEAFSECPYRWDEISEWLKKRRRPRRSGPPPESLSWICPICAQQMKWVYWENDPLPEWLCGRGGWVEICKDCKWWGRYEWRWMS
jgi:hypothetical protein